ANDRSAEKIRTIDNVASAKREYATQHTQREFMSSSELLDEAKPHWGIVEYTRQCGEAIRGPNPLPPQPEYAIGSLEWQRQQEQAKDNDDPRVSGGGQNSGAVKAKAIPRPCGYE